MPELPEVETIKNGLAPFLLGQFIQAIAIRDPTVISGILPSGKPRWNIQADDFKKWVVGKRIQQILRRGKYLLFTLGDQDALMIHLRMTGQLVFKAVPETARAILYFNQSEPLYFCDQRRFGEIRYLKSWRDEKAIQNLGPEPFDKTFNGVYLQSKLKNRSAPVHSILLNQSILAGLGNIYAAESLYMAGIAPQRKAGRISIEKLNLLCDCVKKVLLASIKNRGFSMRNYRDVHGEKGRSQDSALVYGRERQPCRQCGNTLKKRTLAGRGVVFCPKCQK